MKAYDLSVALEQAELDSEMAKSFPYYPEGGASWVDAERKKLRCVRCGLWTHGSMHVHLRAHEELQRAVGRAADKSIVWSMLFCC